MDAYKGKTQRSQEEREPTSAEPIPGAAPALGSFPPTGRLLSFVQRPRFVLNLLPEWHVLRRGSALRKV